MPDFWPSAMYHYDPNANQVQQDDVGNHSILQGFGNHGVPAVFYHHSFPVIFLNIWKGFCQHSGAIHVILHCISS